MLDVVLKYRNINPRFRSCAPNFPTASVAEAMKQKFACLTEAHEHTTMSPKQDYTTEPQRSPHPHIHTAVFAVHCSAIHIAVFVSTIHIVPFIHILARRMSGTIDVSQRLMMTDNTAVRHTFMRRVLDEVGEYSGVTMPGEEVVASSHDLVNPVSAAPMTKELVSEEMVMTHDSVQYERFAWTTICGVARGH
jgi:hypothetical protein